MAKDNKSIYQEIRDNLDMSRADVADASNEMLTESKIEKIENGRQYAQPIDVVTMAKIYNAPELCNYYCSKECEIGKKYVPEVSTIMDLPQTTLALLSSLNTLQKDRDTIIDIVADGKITEDEQAAFKEFRSHLDKMSLAIETLKLWADKELDN